MPWAIVGAEGLFPFKQAPLGVGEVRLVSGLLLPALDSLGGVLFLASTVTDESSFLKVLTAVLWFPILAVAVRLEGLTVCKSSSGTVEVQALGVLGR